MKTILSVSALLLVTCFAPCAFADSMLFGDTVLTKGTGFGNILNLLTLQNDNPESGGIAPPDVETGDAQPTSMTYNVSELTAAGITADNFGLIFNPNETGGSPDTVVVQEFWLDFYSIADLEVPYLSVELLGLPREIAPISTGQGSQGWSIIYTNTGALTEFFATSTNIIGAHGTINLTSDGGDDFNIVQLATPGPGPEPIPEPTSIVLLGLGLIGMVGVRRIAKK